MPGRVAVDDAAGEEGKPVAVGVAEVIGEGGDLGGGLGRQLPGEFEAFVGEHDTE